MEDSPSTVVVSTLSFFSGSCLQHTVQLVWPGSFLWKTEQSEIWAWVVRSGHSHCERSQNRDVDKFWKPLPRNSLQESTLGKNKAFFQQCVCSPKKQKCWGITGSWTKDAALDWASSNHCTLISTVPSALTLVHSPYKQCHTTCTPTPHFTSFLHIWLAVVSASQAPFITDTSLNKAAFHPSGLPFLLPSCTVFPPKAVTSNLSHFHRIFLLSTNLH